MLQLVAEVELAFQLAPRFHAGYYHYSSDRRLLLAYAVFVQNHGTLCSLQHDPLVAH